ncbi:MAG: sensor histidine kinase [Lachnospiraceae bacterium]|nr:sensor histidine kinase [Lachnospiraceae bacterium]
MKSNRSKSVFKNCIKKSRAVIIAYLVMAAVILAVFLLYELPLEPVFYVIAILVFIGLVSFFIFYLSETRKAAKRERIRNGILTEWMNFSDPSSLEEKDYQEMVRTLGSKIEELTAAFDMERQDMTDYYTTWVHQIKTPISVMRMKLAEQDTKENHELSIELFRIEQYVEMVLQYIRLNSETNDLVVKEYSVDDLVRESIRKFAPQFIHRKLALDFQESHQRIVTDKKWFSCMLEQIFSNAVKYTPEGGVFIYTEGETLCIRDTGIGISSEDLPRIFEKGYTGINGRMEKKSSGLGLYLCKKAADKLGIKITVESSPGKGSIFRFDLSQKVY